MCELMGMCFNKPVNPKISFKGFRPRGEHNPHGWGIAMYPDEAVQIIKEDIKATKSKLSKFLTEYHQMASMLYIFHVRYWPYNIAFKNTHPFYREMYGKDYAFAHNGSLNDYRGVMPLGRFIPIGQTDSEYVFCSILKTIGDRNIESWNKEHFAWLTGILRGINSYGNFNCLFSDGEHLFCYHDSSGYRGLNFLRRESPYGYIQLIDDDWEGELSEQKKPGEKGFIIATSRLTDEKWQKFKPGELMVFSEGRLVYSSGQV